MSTVLSQVYTVNTIFQEKCSEVLRLGIKGLLSNAANDFENAAEVTQDIQSSRKCA